MSHIKITLGTFLFAILLGACADDSTNYTCTVKWTLNGQDAGSAEFEYGDLGGAQEAVDMCAEDQAKHPDRPKLGAGDASTHDCDCRSD